MSYPGLNLIAAVAENNVIGIENSLPWRLPNDLAHFKRVTMGHPILMGRLTYESIGRPLPGRLNIVVSRQQDLHLPGVTAVPSVEEGILVAQQQVPDKACFLIGGAQLYDLALPFCDKLYLTRVHAKVHGDAYFPELDAGAWTQVSEEKCAADDNNDYDHSFVVLQRVGKEK